MDNQVRLQLFALAYNLGNFLRRLALPKAVKHWTMTTLREKLVKIGAKVVAHARYVIFQMAEVAIPRKTVRRHPGAHPASAAARSWRGAFRMSQQTAQSRSCSDKPGGSHAPGGENGAFLGLSGASSPGSNGPRRPRSAPDARKKRENVDAKGAWRRTMALHGPAAEPGEVIWEMSAEQPNAVRPA